MEEREQEVWQAVQEINRCWTRGNCSALEDWFHDEMVAISPTDADRIVGKRACIAAWQGFVSSTKIHSWEESAPLVTLFGDTAIVTYYFHIEFDMAGRRFSQHGRDMFTLIFENGRWQVVANQFSPRPN